MDAEQQQVRSSKGTDVFLNRLKARACLSTAHGRAVHDLNVVTAPVQPMVNTARRDIVEDAIQRAKSMQNRPDATNSVLQRLKVEAVTLVPRPTSISHFAFTVDLSDPLAQLQQASYSFFGIWFVVAAVMRFKRPLRRRAVMDGELWKRKAAELQTFQQELLQHVGSTTDVKRAARDMLWRQVQQSTAEVRNQRSMLDRRGGDKRLPANAPSPSVERGPAQPAPPSSAPHSAKPLSIRQALTLRTRVGVSNHGALSQIHQHPGSTSPRQDKGPLDSYEKKVEKRQLQCSAAKIATGKSASGTLALTIAQHANSADPAKLAAFMFKTLGEDRPPTTSNPGTRPPTSAKPPPTAPARPPVPRMMSMPAILSEEDTLASRPGSSRDPSTPSTSLAATTPGRLPMKFATVGRGDTSILGPDKAPTTTLARIGSQSCVGGISHAFASTASLPQGVAPTRPDSISSSTNILSPRQPAKATSYIRARREACAFLPEKAMPVVVLESDFTDVPIPKTDHTIVLAYPPRPGRLDSAEIPSMMQPQSQLEAQFIQRVVTNAYHDDVLQRLRHAEACRNRDKQLKKDFLDARTHRANNSGCTTVQDVIRDLNDYVSSKRQQDGRRERHQRRLTWFHGFYEAIIEKCSFEDIEPLLMLMEEQVNDEFASLQRDCYVELFDAVTADTLRLPSVQFCLCHVAIAYQVPYIEFREMLELRHVPYLLQGSGETFGTQKLS